MRKGLNLLLPTFNNIEETGRSNIHKGEVAYKVYFKKLNMNLYKLHRLLVEDACGGGLFLLFVLG